jgi:Na+/H+ antiporter NhaA
MDGGAEKRKIIKKDSFAAVLFFIVQLENKRSIREGQLLPLLSNVCVGIRGI